MSPKKREDDTLQGATSVGDPRQVSAPVGTSHDPVLTTVDAHPLPSPADVGTPRRILGAGIAPLLFVPRDNPDIPPERYKTLRFLSYDEIAEEFAKWMLSEPRTAYLIGWPVAAYEVWNLAEEVFCPATNIIIESRNNFFAALAKRPEVKRTRDKRVRNDDGGWSKTTVYRFSAAAERAAEDQSPHRQADLETLQANQNCWRSCVTR